MAKRLIERHQLNVVDLRPDNYILVQRWLDALKEIQEAVGGNKLREVGRGIVENAEFPPHYTDAETMLMDSDPIFKMNHRGNVGQYVVTRRPDKTIVIRCETPYPRMFEWGVIEGMTKNQRYKHPGSFTVDYEDGPKTGNVTCTLFVRRIS